MVTLLWVSLSTGAYAKYQYTIKFIDGDTVLSEEHVMEGEDATPPPDPSRDGKTFIGWQGEYTDVKRNAVVLAKYKGEEPVNNVPEEELMSDPGMSNDNTVRSLDGTPITEPVEDKKTVSDTSKSGNDSKQVKSRFSYDPELRERVNQNRAEFFNLMSQEIGNKHLTLEILGITMLGCIVMLIVCKFAI